MELRQLNYVLVVAQEQNFSRAAERLFISQPALSQQIKSIESEAGFPIFHRTTKNVELTPYGQQFVRHAQQVIKSHNNLETWINQMKAYKDSALTFGASPISMRHASAVIPDFLLQFPDVAFNYVEGWDPDLSEAVRTGQMDIALVGLPKSESAYTGLNVVPVVDEEVCIVVSKKHPLHNKESISLSELSGAKIVSTNSQSGLTRLMKSEFALQGLEPNFSLYLTSVEGRLSMVDKGAVTFVMRKQFERLDRSKYSVIPVNPAIYRTLAIITDSERELSVLESSFIEILKNGVAEQLT